MFSYFVFAIIISMKKLGMISIIPWCKSQKTSDIRSNKFMSQIFFSTFLIFSIIALLEIFSVTPDLTFFNDTYLKCDIYNLASDHCSLSIFGIFYLKLYVNMVIFRYIDLFYSASLICLINIFVIYHPIKSVLNFWNSNKEESFA